MPYVGKAPVGGGFHKLDALTASATATYALTLGSAAYYPETANQLLVSLNGVIQAPQDSFTVSGSNLIFDTALTASDSIDFVVALGDVLGVQGVTDGTVTTNKIANGAVTMDKLATSGTLPALDGSNLTGVGVAGISSSSTSGTALGIDANNIVTTPSVPAWRVGLSGDQNVTVNNSQVTIVFNKTDTDNCFLQGGVTISSGIITVPVAGVYQVNATARIDNCSGGFFVLRILRNNTAGSGSDTNIIDGGQDPSYDNFTGSDVFKCDANDNLRVTAFSYSDNIYKVADSTIFSGHLVG